MWLLSVVLSIADLWVIALAPGWNHTLILKIWIPHCQCHNHIYKETKLSQVLPVPAPPQSWRKQLQLFIQVDPQMSSVMHALERSAKLNRVVLSVHHHTVSIIFWCIILCMWERGTGLWSRMQCYRRTSALIMAKCCLCTAAQTSCASVTCASLINTEVMMSSQWKRKWPINRSEMWFEMQNFILRNLIQVFYRLMLVLYCPLPYLESEVSNGRYNAVFFCEGCFKISGPKKHLTPFQTNK